MQRLRVWIDYQPAIYTDIFTEIFQSLGLADMITGIPDASAPIDSVSDSDSIDLVILSLDNLGQPELEITPQRLQNARMIAFSPSGDYGLVRLPGKTCWEEIQPFGLKQLIEQLSGEPAR